ncbi:MAG: hypothetical protein CME61_03355 [Halobacteriovoraceae bacterium]|nr:hypothetical protein [Halobacteriovoraceae bacterium]|tara:strand:+ start:1023 stop:1760 length:738 start_codon:yes stop_codon:yes gene_type:complete
MKLFFILVMLNFKVYGATIIIDPGHGGEEKGAVSPIDGTQEKDLALYVAKKIKENLIDDHHVYLTRTQNQTITLEQRSLSAQKIGADLFISVHLNSSESSNSNGFETYYLDSNQEAASNKIVRVENGEHSHPMKKDPSMDFLTGEILADIVVSKNIPLSKELGNEVHDAISKGISKEYKVKDRGLKPGLFYVLAMSKVPGVLLEVGFLSNKNDLRLIKDKGFLDKYSKHAAIGIKNYLNSKMDKN